MSKRKHVFFGILFLTIASANFAEARCYMGHGNWSEDENLCNKPPDRTHVECYVGSKKPVKYYEWQVADPNGTGSVYVYGSLSFAEGDRPKPADIQKSEACQTYRNTGQDCELLGCF